jgi:hypothetical protein
MSIPKIADDAATTKTADDGTPVELASTVDAMRYAVEIQRAMAAPRSASLEIVNQGNNG